MEQLFTSEMIYALLALTAIEIVLGIDNVIFIAILCSRLPKHLQDKARVIGLTLAMFTRIILLFCIAWIMKLTEPVLFGLSGRDLILLGGGLFLIWKSVHEIHNKMEAISSTATPVVAGFGSVIFQILLIDIVFSLDSVITAVGMVNHMPTMISAIVISMVVMVIFSGSIAKFIDKHPTFKILALSFLILIGVLLVAESFGKHFDRGYIYFAMAFSICVELVNMKIRPKSN